MQCFWLTISSQDPIAISFLVVFEKSKHTWPWCHQSARGIANIGSIANGWCWLDTGQCQHFWNPRYLSRSHAKNARCRHSLLTVDNSFHCPRPCSCSGSLAPHCGGIRLWSNSCLDRMATSELLLRWQTLWLICSNLIKIMKTQTHFTAEERNHSDAAAW